MRVLVLWADDASFNLGVRALGQGSAAVARQAWPEAEVEFHNYGNASPHVPHGQIRSLVKERVTGKRGMRDWLAGFDAIIDTRSGDSFADIYGLQRLRTMSAVAEFATQAGTPLVMGPQTIGPFGTREGRAIGRFSLKRARASMARDTESANYAATIGRPVDLLTTDVVFALPVPVVPKTRDVILNISGLLWQPGPHVDWRSYRQVVTELCARLVASGRRVTLLAHVIDSPFKDNDVPAIKEFVEAGHGQHEVVIPSTLDEVREVVASAAVVIGSRMHACLNALSVGTPAVPLAYSRKFAPLLADLGWEATVDLRRDPASVASVLKFLDASDLSSDALQVAERARHSLNDAADLLRSVR